jgi:hypothetical protein
MFDDENFNFSKKMLYQNVILLVLFQSAQHLHVKREKSGSWRPKNIQILIFVFCHILQLFLSSSQMHLKQSAY